METYEFSIIASGLDPRADDFEQRFYDVGCDDATVSFQKGHIILDFARDAESAEEAIASAVDAVGRAGATVNRIEPDPLVSLSEIAARSGLTRAAISNYSSGKRARDFPSPVARVTTETPLWDWFRVSAWMLEHQRSPRVDYRTVHIAAVVHAANGILEGGPTVDFRCALTGRLRANEAVDECSLMPA